MNAKIGLAMFLVACVAACSSNERAPLQSHTLRLTQAGLPFVQDSGGRWYVVDTGSPRTTVTPEGAGVPGARGEMHLPGWALELEPGDVSVLVTDKPTGFDQGMLQPYAGVIGLDVLMNYTLTFDPRAHRLDAEPAELALPSEGRWVSGAERLGPGSFCLQDGQCAHFGPSRLAFPVTIEGVATWAVLDTGSRTTGVTRALFGRLPVDEHRAVAQTSRWSRARTRDFRLGLGEDGPTLSQSTILMSDDETAFAKLRVETGRPIEVLLGQSYLQSFVTRVDARNARVGLVPYDDARPTSTDELVGLGAVLTIGAQCFAVADVYVNHDAATKGVRAGDCVTGVDDLALTFDTTGLLALDAHVRGRGVGSSVHATLRRGAETYAVDLLVEDLLPRLP